MVETSIPDVAIEHRGYLYNQDQTSSITCRSQIELDSIQPLEIDQGCTRDYRLNNHGLPFFLLGKHWPKNALNYFTYPNNFTRNQSMSFCANNNGTLMYWADLNEQDAFQGNSLIGSFRWKDHSFEQIFSREKSTNSFVMNVNHSLQLISSLVLHKSIKLNNGNHRYFIPF